MAQHPDPPRRRRRQPRPTHRRRPRSRGTEPAQPRAGAAQPLPRPALGDRLQRPDPARAARQRERSPARRTSSSTSKRCSAARLYADFALLWLVCHQSRVEADKPEDCWLERWTQDRRRHGHPRARRAPPGRRGGDRERSAPASLPTPPTDDLHEQLADGRLDPLTTTARCCGSSTGCCSCSSPRTATRCSTRPPNKLDQDRYTAHYSTAHLRELASKRRGGRHHDRYEQLKLVMAALARARPARARASTARQLPLGPRRDRPARGCEARERGPARRGPRRSRPSSTTASAAPSTSATSAPRNSAPSTNRCLSSTRRSTATRATSRSTP